MPAEAEPREAARRHPVPRRKAHLQKHPQMIAELSAKDAYGLIGLSGTRCRCGATKIPRHSRPGWAYESCMPLKVARRNFSWAPIYKGIALSKPLEWSQISQYTPAFEASGPSRHTSFRACSSAGEHFVDIEGVTGSIPVTPTIMSPNHREIARTEWRRRSRRMKVRNSLRSLKNRHRDCRVVRRKGRIYVINKTQRRFKARQG